MYCSVCGSVLDQNGVCPQCVPGNAVPAPAAPVAMTDWKNSFFDGGFWGLLGVNLLCAFVGMITLGFAWPSLYCFRLRWLYSHTVVGGYRLKFTGRGIQFFGRCLLWALLTLVTFGIYSLWLPIVYQKWVTKHLEIDSQIPA